MTFSHILGLLFSIFVIIIAYFYGLPFREVFLLPEDSTPLTSAIIFEFENFENNLTQTVSNLCATVPHVFVLSDTFIYPPVDFPHSEECKVEVIEERKSPLSSYAELNLHSRIKSSYLLVIPDFTKITNVTLLHQTQVDFLNEPNYDGFLIPIYPSDENTLIIECRRFNFDVKKWTLFYNKDSPHCEYINEYGFVLLIRNSALFRLHQPFRRPFGKAFAIQSLIANLSIKLVNLKILHREKQIFSTDRLQVKHDQFESYRLAQFYHDIGIKKIRHLDNSTELFGCDRHKPRCFGSIVNDTPDYLIQNRWTSPCCLRNLEITGRYVIDLLEKFKVRYWLEGGSLLGAARDGQIIPWDYDIDLGIYREDAIKLTILSSLMSSEGSTQIQDGQGFVWEKAIEGDFIKVHFSKINRIHVDIFPFQAINGTMTKDTWFEDHPQDMPFPEHYLRPLNTINFIGIEANAPNNVKQFLEMKFGEGVIENPKYPRPVRDFSTD